MNKAKLVKKFPDMGREVWALWDDDADAYELFTEQECECCVGNADTWGEVLEVTAYLCEEWMND